MADIKKKTLYTAYSRTLSTIIGFLSQFILTPIILGCLGKTLYGIYAIVNKANNFLSLVDLRPTAVLRLQLAHDQLSENKQRKRQFIGASYIVSLFFTPVFVIGGFILAYFFPEWFHIESEFVRDSRLAIICLSAFLAINGFWAVPEAVLRGNNLEYKGFFVEPIRQLLVAGLTIYFLLIGWGLLAVIAAMFIGALFAYVSRWLLRKKYLPIYTAQRPSRYHIKYFFKKGGWYLISSFLMQIINNFDVLLIGILMTPEAVAIFAVTKSLIFRIVEAVENLVTSSTSSIGEIVGSADNESITHARSKLMRIVWPLSLALTSYFFIFNGSFIHFWTGSSVYAGDAVNTLICISAIFLMMTSTEEIFIQSSLDFKRKSLMQLISAIVAIVVSIMLSRQLGLVGNAIGILSGRGLLYLLYYELNNRTFNCRIMVNPALILKSISFLLLIIVLKFLSSEFASSTLTHFIISSALFLLFIGIYGIYVFLGPEDRIRIFDAVQKKSSR